MSSRRSMHSRSMRSVGSGLIKELLDTETTVTYGSTVLHDDDDDDDDDDNDSGSNQLLNKQSKDNQSGNKQDEEEQLDKNATRLQNYGHACGLLYISVILCGLTARLGVRDTLIDFDSISNTINNITEFPVFFRAGIMIDLIMCCCDAGVAILLGAILIHAGANPVIAIASSAFRFLNTGTIAMNLMHMMVASILLDPNYYFATVIEGSSLQDASTGGGDNESTHAHDIAYMFLVVHKYGFLLALIFLGVSMIILGGIILKWGIFPHVLGIFSVLAGLGYIVDSCFYFITSGYFGEATTYLMIPAAIFETGLAVWLLCGLPRMAKKD